MAAHIQSWFQKSHRSIGIFSVCKHRFRFYCSEFNMESKRESSTGTAENQFDQKEEAIDSMTRTQDASEQKDIPKSKVFYFLKFVKLEKLSEGEKLIHARHIEALKKDEDVYKDPATGYDVISRLGHLRRGECCGNACRHCPYGQKKVPVDQPKKKFNTAFYF